MNSSDLEVRERWVTCPICGKKVQKSWVSISDMTCNCGTEFTACVTKEFVATILHAKGDNLSMKQRIERFAKQLTEVVA